MKVGRRSILIAVDTAKAGKLSIGLARGKRTVARASAILGGGSKGVKLRLPKGLKAGKHTLKVTFKPVGATKAVTKRLSINLTGAKKAKAKAKKASIARAASARPRIDHSTVPAPKLPDGRHP